MQAVCGLVLFLFVGEIAGLHVVDVFGNGVVDDGSQVGIAAEETWRESLIPDFVNAYPKNHQRIEVRYVDAVS